MNPHDDLQAALAAGRVGTWEYDPGTGRLSSSENLPALYGLDAPQSMETYGTRVRSDYREAVERATNAALGRGEPIEIEFPVELPDGSTRWLVSRAQPVRDADGSVLRWIGAVVDITEQKSALERLERSERDLRRLLDAMPAIAVLLAADGAVEYRNAYWRRMVEGLAPEEVSAGSLVHPDDLDDTFAAFREGLRRGEPFEREYRVRDPATGEYRWFLTRWSPVRDAEGRVERWISVATDIHEQRLAADALRDANRMKDEFIGFVSHELRSPITVLLGLATRLARHPERVAQEDLRALGDDMYGAAQRLRDVVDNLMALAFAEHADAGLEPVALPELAEHVIATHCSRYPRPPVEVSHAGSLPKARANPTWVDLVLTNLLGNAAKYCPPTEPVLVVFEAGTGDVVTRVLDRGPGIPEHQASRLFDAFYRGDRRDGAPGAGLGLTVCRRLVEMQGGEIWCSPRAGGGSEFGFSLPAVIG